MANGFIWYELMTTDAPAAAALYGELHGWTAQPSGPTYTMLFKDGEGVGGILALTPEQCAQGASPGWLGYVGVDDVDAGAAGFAANGGAIHMPPWDVPGVGRMALVADPQGAALYLMTPPAEMRDRKSLAFAPERNGHFAWNELHTSDAEAAMAFYAARFGWVESQAMDMGPMGKYRIFDADGRSLGGMMNSPNFPRTAWLPYVQVADAGARADRARALGAEILHAGPVPGGNMVQARDPQGAIFAFVDSIA